MKKLMLMTSAATIGASFANSGKNAKSAEGGTPAANGAPTTETPAADAKAERVEPVITAVRALALPASAKSGRGRGSVSKYPFDSLTAPSKNEAGEDVFASFGVANKTAKQLGSIVTNQNKKFREPKKDANGATVFKMQTLTAADGATTQVPTQEPEMVQSRKFQVFDVDPATDEDGASARVFRIL